MTPKTFDPLLRRLRLLSLLLALGFAGCSWLNALKPEAGPGFSKWSQNMSTGAGSSTEMGETKEKSTPKSKSMFFDERSRAVEKSIGYEE